MSTSLFTRNECSRKMNANCIQLASQLPLKCVINNHDVLLQTATIYIAIYIALESLASYLHDELKYLQYERGYSHFNIAVQIYHCHILDRTSLCLSVTFEMGDENTVNVHIFATILFSLYLLKRQIR